MLELTSAGLTNQEAAEQLGLTVHTIKFHLSAIYRKLGVGNRTAAAAAYLSDRPVVDGATAEPAS